MKTYRIPHTDLEVSRIGYGCMKLGGRWDNSPLTTDDRSRAARLIDTVCAQGVTLFDHADIYMWGKSEAVFGEILRQRPGLRQRVIVQTKCGIRFAGTPGSADPARYDFSYNHIVTSVEGSLKRLQTDVIDILLLHRPDALVEPEQVARAFDELHRSGKVRYFGVSNHTAGQIALLRRYVDQPLVVNQLELNLIHSRLIAEGLAANQSGCDVDSAVGLLDYCRLHDILVQAWSPVAHGALLAPAENAPEPVRRVAAHVAAMANAKSTSPDAVAVAWLLRHPAGIQPLLGTARVERLVAGCQADTVELSRSEWYALLEAYRGPLA